MERDELLEMAREEIFDKMHKFNYINNIEVIDDVKEDSNLHLIWLWIHLIY